MDHPAFGRWIVAYEHAWRTAGTAQLAELFTGDAVYLHSPYASPLVGLPAIAQDWEREREGPDEVFTMDAEILAVDPAAAAVADVLVRYGDPVRQEYRDLWVVRFDGHGRATRFEEWPFWPGQPWVP